MTMRKLYVIFKIVAPRERRVSRNQVIFHLLVSSSVAPRERRVSRNIEKEMK